MTGTIEPEFVGVRGIENTTAEFREKLGAVAMRIGAKPRDLANVMAFETGGTFSPSVRNVAGSGATGLIQFMPSTAIRLGTTTAALARMSAVEQLDYVERYFSPFRGRGLDSEHDLYMAVLYPEAIGKGLDHVLFRRGTRAYGQNAGLDRNKDGVVLAGEASSSMLGGAGARPRTRSRNQTTREDGSKPSSGRKRPPEGDAARARDGLVRVHRIPVPAPDVILLSGDQRAGDRRQAGPLTPPSQNAGDDSVVGAIAGLFAVAAEHYKGRDPELASRYESIASAIASMAGPDNQASEREASEGAARRSPDAGLAIEPPS